MRTRVWLVTVTLHEHEDHTRAVAVMKNDIRGELRHEGVARTHRRDRATPEIADELAAFRALTGLAYEILDTEGACAGSQPASAEKAS